MSICKLWPKMLAPQLFADCLNLNAADHKYNIDTIAQYKLFFRSANDQDDAKREKLDSQQRHLSLAVNAREFYRKAREDGKASRSVHLSFDFAQQVNYVSITLDTAWKN